MAICLVTGGAGFVGSHLVEGLVRAGHVVRVLDNFSTGDLANLAEVADRIEIRHGDLADANAIHRAVCGCEVVFHLATLPSVPRSVTDPLEAHSVCATGTLRVLVAARQNGVRRVVYAASAGSPGSAAPAARREADPQSPLAVAKLSGEQYCQAFRQVYGLETVCLRYFNAFGPRQQPGGPYAAVVPKFLDAMLAGRRPLIYGDGRQTRDFTYVEDVVRASLLALAARGVAGKVYDIGSGQFVTLLELVDLINDLLGTRILPEYEPPRPGDVLHCRADLAPARAELGYEPAVSLREGLRRCLPAARARIAEKAFYSRRPLAAAP